MPFYSTFRLYKLVAFMLNGCAHGSQKEASECLEDSLPADLPMGYVIELRPLGDFSQEKAKQVRVEFVKQMALLFPDQPKSWLEASVYVSENKEIPATCLYKLHIPEHTRSIFRGCSQQPKGLKRLLFDVR